MCGENDVELVTELAQHCSGSRVTVDMSHAGA